MYLENAINDMAQENTFEWITVTVANAKTGAILGSATTPSYDPNKLNITNYNNPLVSYSYEPGSTMKIFSFMAAMEEGIYKPDELFLSGTKMLGKDKVTDWNKTGWGNITFDKGFTYSSNVAAAELGLELGKDKLIEYYKRFGFGSKTGIEMADEYSGIINPKYELEIANAAFGQGITTTPIQNIQALTTLANNGMLIKPYIVDKVIDPDTGETIYEGKRTEIEQVVNPETVDKMLELMNETVNGEDAAATGYVYRTASTALIGKTGTAQIVSSSGGYQTGNYNNIRSFAGLFPYKDPEYIVYISVKKLQASSRALAKPVKSIVESIAKYKNLDQLIVEQDESKIIKIENYINSYTDETLSKLENSGLEVVKIGVGSRIIDQFPQKGSTMIKGNKLFLLTNSTEIFMPSMENWTTSEVGNYCNLAGINYNISGYGRVRTQSIPAGTELDLTSILDVTLTRKEEEVTTDEETEQTE